MTGEAETLRKMIEQLDICFFLTSGPSTLSSRPMSSVFVDNDPKIYFLTERSSRLDDDVQANPDAVLNYGNGSNKFAVVYGKASRSTDRAVIKSLWNPGAQAFWPEGPDDADVVAIAVQPQKAEYWDGPTGFVAAAKMAVAFVTGSRPDLGDKAEVRL